MYSWTPLSNVLFRYAESPPPLLVPFGLPLLPLGFEEVLPTLRPSPCPRRRCRGAEILQVVAPPVALSQFVEEQEEGDQKKENKGGKKDGDQHNHGRPAGTATGVGVANSGE